MYLSLLDKLSCFNVLASRLKIFASLCPVSAETISEFSFMLCSLNVIIVIIIIYETLSLLFVI